MKVSSLKEKTENILRHPYLAALLLCFATEALTLCQEEYMTGTSVMILVVSVIAFAFYKLVMNDKPKYLHFGLVSVCASAVGFGMYFIGHTGLILLLTGFICLAVLYLIYKKKLLKPSNLNFILLSMAVLLYISYVLYTVCYVRQTDSGTLESESGHIGYIRYMYNNWFVLSDENPLDHWQFYHPPLYYMISAACMRIVSGLGFGYEVALESCQMVSLFSGLCILITSCRLFKALGLKDHALSAAAAVVAFSSCLVMFCGTTGNDPLATAFEVGVLYCTIKWYRDHSMINIVQIAICMGLGTMTKLSVAMTVPVVALVFIYVFFKEIKNCPRWLGQFAVFIIICAPLALWFPIRNLIMFSVPLGYVQDGGEREWITSMPIWQRVIDFSPYQFEYPFIVEEGIGTSGIEYFYSDFNPLVSLFKSAVELTRMKYLTYFFPIFNILMYLNIVLGITGFVYMIYELFSGKKNLTAEMIIVDIFYFTLLISYYIFCFRNPNTYAENIRYVFPMVITGALYIGRLCQRSSKSKAYRYLKNGVYGIVTAYSATELLLWTALAITG